MQFTAAVVASATFYLTVRAQSFGYDDLESGLYVRDIDDADLDIRDSLGDFYDELTVRDAEAEAGQYRKQMKTFRVMQKASGASKESRRAAIKEYRVQAKAAKAQRQAAKGGGGAGGGAGGAGGGGGDPNAAGGGGPPPPPPPGPDASGGGGGGGGDAGGGGGGDAQKRSIENEEEFYLQAREARQNGGFSKVPMRNAAGGFSQVAYDADMRSRFAGRSLQDGMDDEYMEELLIREAEAYPEADAEAEAWFWARDADFHHS